MERNLRRPRDRRHRDQQGDGQQFRVLQDGGGLQEDRQIERAALPCHEAEGGHETDITDERHHGVPVRGPHGAHRLPLEAHQCGHADSKQDPSRGQQQEAGSRGHQRGREQRGSKQSKEGVEPPMTLHRTTGEPDGDPSDDRDEEHHQAGQSIDPKSRDLEGRGAPDLPRQQRGGDHGERGDRAVREQAGGDDGGPYVRHLCRVS